MVFMARALALPRSAKKLSDYAEGDLVLLNEDGVPTEYYVAKHDYESALNGTGRTLVVRKDVGVTSIWNTYNSHGIYNTSYIANQVVTTYRQKFDAAIKTAMATTKIKCATSLTSYAVGTYEKSVFLLSAYEYGFGSAGGAGEGTPLPIASTLRNNEKLDWTRSPLINAMGPYVIIRNGKSGYGLSVCNDTSSGMRPVFTLPGTLEFDQETNKVMTE